MPKPGAINAGACKPQGLCLLFYAKWEVTKRLKAVTWSVVLKAWLSYYVEHRLEEVRIQTG